MVRHRLIGSSLAVLLTLTIVGGGGPAVAVRTTGHTGAARVWTNYTAVWESDGENPVGPEQWGYSIFGLVDGHSDVVVDRTEPVHHDGSLRLTTDTDGDGVEAGYDFRHKPAFAAFSGSYALKVVAGPPAAYGMSVVCPARFGKRSSTVAMQYAGPFPKTPGWHRINVSRKGRALWSSDRAVGSLRAGPRHRYRLSDFIASCPGGRVVSHGFRVTAHNAISYVDAITLMDKASNFFVPPVRRLEIARSQRDACDTAQAVAGVRVMRKDTTDRCLVLRWSRIRTGSPTSCWPGRLRTQWAAR